MTKYKLNRFQKRLPHGGHHFVERGVTIKGDSVTEVAGLLENYRLINGRPLGNAYQEIVDYYASKYPWMVIKDLDPQEDEEIDQDYIDWRNWISSVWGKPMGKWISRKEASMRWEVCKNCPFNAGKPWDLDKEATEFDRKSLLLRRGESVPENYQFCSLHKADIGVSSFIESPMALSRKDPDKQAPSQCWFHPLSGGA